MHSIICQDHLNAHGERLQYVGDIVLNLDYWDCECENDFVHSISQQTCNVCGSEQEESPSSRENEVQLLLRRKSAYLI